MEHYNKEKHHDLVLEHIKQAALSGLELDIYTRCDNYGNGLTELVINETDSILMKSKEFQEIFDEVYGGITYYQATIDYIAAVDESSKDIQFYHREHQGTTALRYPRSGELRVNKIYMKGDS